MELWRNLLIALEKWISSGEYGISVVVAAAVKWWWWKPLLPTEIKLSRVPTWLDLLQCCNHVVQTLLLHWITRLCIVVVTRPQLGILLPWPSLYVVTSLLPKMCNTKHPREITVETPPFSSAHSLFMNSSHISKKDFDVSHTAAAALPENLLE